MDFQGHGDVEMRAVERSEVGVAKGGEGGEGGGKRNGSGNGRRVSSHLRAPSTSATVPLDRIRVGLCEGERNNGPQRLVMREVFLPRLREYVTKLHAAIDDEHCADEAVRSALREARRRAEEKIDGAWALKRASVSVSVVRDHA